MKTIEVIVSPTGATEVQTKGYAGPECLEASRWLETALGTAKSERKTAEFFQAHETQQQEVQQ